MSPAGDHHIISNICSNYDVISSSCKVGVAAPSGEFFRFWIDKERHSMIEFDEIDRNLWEKLSKAEGESKVYVLIELGSRAVERDDFKDALALFEAARDIYQELGSATNMAILGYLYAELAETLMQLKRPVEAAEEARKAVVSYRLAGSPQVLNALSRYGDLCYSAKDYEASFQVHKSALQEPLSEADDYFIASSFGNCAFALVKMKRWSEALEFCIQARTRFKILRDPRQVAYWDELISLCYFWLGRGDDALHHAQMALDFATITGDELRLQWSNMRMGMAKELLGEYEIALKHFSLAKDYMVSFNEMNWEQLILLERHVADIYFAQGKSTESAEIRRRLVAIEDVIAT